MTQKQDSAQKLAEMNEIFLGLNEKGQESALMVLKALEFAQSVMYRNEKQVVEQRGQ